MQQDQGDVYKRQAYSYKKFKVLRLKKKDFNVEKDYYKTHLKIAIPMGLQFSVTAVGIIIVQSAVNVFGSDVIASYTCLLYTSRCV